MASAPSSIAPSVGARDVPIQDAMPHRPVLAAVRDLHRHFNGRPALQGVDVDLRAGDVHALLGPNGAGKTTLLRVLTGLAAPTSGTVTILGEDGSGRRSRTMAGRVGLVPSGTRTFYLRISGLENLIFFARLHGLRRREATKRARETLRDVGLGEAADRRVDTYSQGMQRRLAMARALLTRPDVLLVDEATHDLDPEGAEAVRQLTLRAAGDGAAVLWTTQRVEEIRGFAHSVTFLDRGVVRFAGSVTQLIDRAPIGRYVLALRDGVGNPVPARAVSEAVRHLAHVLPAPGADHVLIELRGGAPLGRVIAALAVDGHDVVACRPERSEIEEAFLALTSEGRAS
ncbi:ABC transporter ATP-binding protein [Baekduia sp.]|uniref:ABC transporter ATP-binding protein n=1 Tax=Baekduia sp. TaxID=2600305 RepID=UPI002D1F9D23|nr:ABC transporter ATP-binding protein [Baekduia sp.]